MNIDDYKKEIKNKKIAVLGYGISNRPLVRVLENWQCDVTVFDRRNRDELEKEISSHRGTVFFTGENYLKNLKGFDVIFKTPVVRPDIPELEEERKKGAVITSEMEMFLKLCRGKTIGITGSDGKTTTTTIIYEILKEQGYNCYLGGNIGNPLFEKLDEINKNDFAVVELSSFQLMTMDVSPQISVITNISPNHLDVHKSYKEYITAKESIYKFQSENDICVLNKDNKITESFAENIKGSMVFFSARAGYENCVYVKGEGIYINNNGKEEYIMDKKDIYLPGNHSVENYMAAIAAVFGLVDIKNIIKTAKTFKGVEHRLEFVREKNGIKFINDSMGTSPTRTIAGLESFDKKVILIAGGKDKNISFEKMGMEIIRHVKHLVLIGQTKEKIKNAVLKAKKNSNIKTEILIIECENLKEAVLKAYDIAEPGDIILLSPAGSSFDMFKNFEERGNVFKAIVKSI